jgi:hypothetical protein
MGAQLQKVPSENLFFLDKITVVGLKVLTVVAMKIFVFGI